MTIPNPEHQTIGDQSVASAHSERLSRSQAQELLDLTNPTAPRAYPSESTKVLLQKAARTIEAVGRAIDFIENHYDVTILDDDDEIEDLESDHRAELTAVKHVLNEIAVALIDPRAIEQE